ncbi:MAG: SGNH/GDSL hydrolase family protein [Candidatus Delongbacteria bacterium]
MKAQNRIITSLRWLPISIIIAYAMIEILMRLFHLGNEYNFNPDIKEHLFIEGKRQVTIKEGFGIRNVNKYGTFDAPKKDCKSDNRYLLFGDSMTEAFQVSDDQIYDNVAENFFMDSLGEEIEIVNFGRSGYSTLDELVLYNQVADKIPHKTVIIQFSSGDVIENFMSKNKIVNDGLVPFSRSENGGSLKRIFWLAKRNSVLLNTAHLRFDMLRSYISSWKRGVKILGIENVGKEKSILFRINK